MAAKTKKTKKKSPRNKTKKKNNKAGLERKQLLLLVVSSAAVLAVILCAVFVKGTRYEKADIKTLSDTAWGIDVSSHNGKIDWKEVKNEAAFAFIRIGYRGYATGEINFDKQAKANLKGANKYGVPAGVYFYSQAINEKEAEEEAEFVLSKIKGYNVTLPVVIDFEFAYKDDKRVGRLSDAGLNKKQKTKLVTAFCDKVREAGYSPGIYASSYIYRSHFVMKDIPDDVFIWVADYNGSVSYDGYYDIWQYSEKGSCSGVSSENVDVNYFYTKNRMK